MTDRVINIDMAYRNAPPIDWAEISALIVPAILFGLATVVVLWCLKVSR